MNAVSASSHAMEPSANDFDPASLTGRDKRLLELGEALQRCAYRFTTVSPATHARVNGRPGNEWARDLCGVLGWSRPFHPDAIPGELFALMQDAGILIPYREGFRSRLRASSLGRQLFFHSAYPTTESDAVFFGPDTYRFANAIDQFFASRTVPVRRAIDIGCGAGPGAVLVARHCPDAEVWATDINPAALKLAAVNAALANASNVRPCVSNLLNDVQGSFDLVISNPPYLVDPAERAYRHGGGSLGAGLSLDIVRAALARLAAGGSLLLYTGAAMLDGADPLRESLYEILRDEPIRWTYREMDPDIFGEELACEAYAQADRIAAVVVTLTKSV